jgi:hypothetical protein
MSSQSSIKSSNASQFVRSHGANRASRNPYFATPATASGRSMLPPPVPAAARVQKAPSSIAPIELGPSLPNSDMFQPLSAKNSARSTWLRLGAVGVGAGLLIAAGYIGGMAKFEAKAPLTPYLVEHVATVATAQPVALPVEHREVALTSAHETSPSLSTVAPIAVPETTTTEATPTRVKPARKAAHARAKTRAPRSAPVAVVADADEEETEVAAAPAKSTLPEQPTRESVQKGIESVRSQLAACAGGTHGMMYANVAIAGSGRVSYTTVEGAFAGTPAGSCMARTLRSATFPQFTASSFKVRYPFSF